MRILFFWTINEDILDNKKDAADNNGVDGDYVVSVLEEKEITVGDVVTHKDYGEGVILEISEEDVDIDFDGKYRVFPFPEAFEREYLIRI